MTRKLTITVDSELLPKAKRYDGNSPICGVASDDGFRGCDGQAAAARACGAQPIVTRNVRDFKRSPGPAITPREALAELS